jgi:N-hydroxyarylamine O-acetyltransferase
MPESIDLDAYFARIGHDGPREPSLATLRAIAERHPKAIPFENLDALTGKVPGLSVADLEAKLVKGGRGGYCFEHNGLTEAVLGALGFELQPLGGRVQWGAPADAPLRPRTHKLLRVTTEEGDWLVDTGFGGIVLTAPLDFHSREPQDTGHGVFRLQDVEDEIQLQAMTREGWAPKYRFSLQPQRPADYEMANWFTATHPSTPFPTNLICSRVFDDRRIGLWNRELAIRWRDGAVEKQTLGLDNLIRTLIEDIGLPEHAVTAARPVLSGLPL